MNTTAYISKMELEGILVKRGRALDLGCGTGKDAIALAEMGFAVEAVDADEMNIVQLIEVARHSEDKGIQLKAAQSDIREYPIPKDTYQIIIASNVLPFIADKRQVTDLISRMADGLLPGGVLYFTVFGPKDAWATKGDMSFFGYQEMTEIVSALPLEIYERSTTEGYGRTRKGDIKYWHIHRFMCRRK